MACVFSKLQKFLLLEFKGLDVPSRNSERDIGYNSRDMQNDTIASWESVETSSNKLEVQVINNEDSLFLPEVHGAPPKIIFFFQILEDYTIYCFKRFTQIEYNDLVKSFRHWVEQYSQVRNANRNIPMNWKIQLTTWRALSNLEIWTQKK